MRKLVIPIALLAFATAVRTLEAQQAPRTETRIFDISALVEPHVDTAMPPFGLPLRGDYLRHRDEPYLVDAELAPGVGTEEVLNVIRTTVAPESWDQPTMRISVLGGGSLVISQTPDALDRIAALLADLAESVHRPIDVEALIVDASHAAVAGHAAQSGLLSAATFESMRGGREQGMRVIFSGASPTYSGRRTGILDVRQSSINGDFDVEVAQTAQIADPRIIDVHFGTAIMVRPTLLEDGRINLRVQATVIEEPKITAFSMGSPSLGKVQLPSVALTELTANAIVASGEAFVAGAVAGDDEPRRLLVVRATHRAKKEKETQERIRVFDIGYPTGMRSPSAAASVGPGAAGPKRQNGGDVGGIDELLNRENEGIDGGQIADMVRTTVSPRKWDEGGNAMWIDGPRMICVGDRDLLGGVHDLLNGLAAARARFASVGVYVVTIPRATLANLRSNQNDAWLRQVMRSPETQRRYSTITTAEFGTAVDVITGRETAYVADYNAEIAQGSSISDPQIETYFAGLYGRFLVYHGGARGRFGIHFKATIADAPREADVFDGGASDYGRIHEPRIRASVVSGSTLVDDKDYCLLGEVSGFGAADDVGLVIAQVSGVPDAK